MVNSGIEHRRALAEAREANRRGAVAAEAWHHITECSACRAKIDRSVRKNPKSSYGNGVDEFLERIKPIGY